MAEVLYASTAHHSRRSSLSCILTAPADVPYTVGMSLLLAFLLQAQAPAPLPSDLEGLKARIAAEAEKTALQRLPAVAALGELKSEEAAAALLELVEKDKEPSVKAAAVKALAACGTPAAVQTLALVARDPQRDLSLRLPALEGLVRPPRPEVLAACKALLRETGDLRYAAWTGLRQYPLDRETEPLWRNGLAREDPIIRALSLAALAPLKEVAHQDLARKALSDPGEDPFLRQASVGVLRAAGGVFNTRTLLAAAAAQPDPTLRRLLSEALGAADDEKSAAEIYGSLKHGDPVVRAVAARALGRLPHAQAESRLNGPLKDPQIEVRAAALEAVAERRGKTSESVLLREAQGSHEDAAALAISLLPAFPGEAVRKALVKLAGSAKTAVAVPALDALGELGGEDAPPVFEKALRARDWPVRVSAVRGLRKLRTAAALDLLVARFHEEEGRIFADIGDALRAMTGRSFGNAPGRWKEWWAANREGFVFPSKDDPPPAPEAGMTTYYGIPVVSTRLVFCVDISGSMSAQAEAGKSRLDQAKAELLRALGQLDKDAQVNLVFFDDRIEPWHRQLVGIKQNLKPAQELIKRLQPRGQTNICGALEAAFAHKEADTVYLLSDGEPTQGRITDPDDLLREVQRWNRLRKVAVHTVSFGGSPFLKALAEQNGGRYVEIP
jgi:HEAT repeat protein